MNKVQQVSRYLVRMVASEIGEDTLENISNPVDSGFGADGPLRTEEFIFSNPSFPDQSVYVFLPESVQTPVPMLLFLHGYNGGDPTIFHISYRIL
jgi:hypothetical protein